MGFDQLTARWQLGRQLIQTNGVTYNVYGDPQGRERPWLLDPVPLVLDAAEWADIERSIIQRATLLNAIQQDLYSGQRLIQERRLPPALVYGNPNFLRPCYGFQPEDGVYLHLYAADLARSPNGDWWVLADRTQAPSGIGYALENRLVSARTLPTVFNQTSIRSLGGFFDVLRESLERIAPLVSGRQPGVVLLTPGPNNETYFEHSFLARHWGIPLVEGADLTVRDDYVFLKTLAGLEPVDVILRRLDDSFCDPLELRGDSLLGVAGLTQAARRGNVSIANALGSGVMETPAHMAFLPGLCRHILGETLRMPSVATWWCGHLEARRYVLDNLESLVIKPTFPHHGRHPEFPAYMSAGGRQELAQRMDARPQEYVAQELVALSTSPVRTNDGLEPRHTVLRVFAAWNGESYTVLPGGLTRVSTETNSVIVSMQLGGGSKDTWVLTGPATLERQSAQAQMHAEARRSTAELPSRVADNFFWLGRYAERVESGVRLVRALLPCLSGEEDFGQSTSLETATQILQALHFLPEEFSKAGIAEQRWQVQKLLSSLIYDPARSSGIGWNLKHVRRVSWPLKQRLSQDTWRVLQRLEQDFTSAPPADPELRLVAQMDLLDRIVMTLSAFAGLLTENTVRTHGQRFLDIGRRLERALQTCELVHGAMAQAPFEIDSSLKALLEIADSGITYRSRYYTAMRIEFVLELLVADETNPRSLGFQLAALADQLAKLPGYDSEEIPPPLQIAIHALSRLRASLLEDLAARDANGDLAELEEFIVKMKGTLYDLSNSLTARHLTLLTATRMRPSR
jgi:uncharacterized circularly permuted ATP-grasp superfamily protein/uncharacterized alpha-E superfamily protein